MAARSALFAGVFKTGITLGAFTGARAADALGPTAVPCLGGGLALLALPAVVRAGQPGAEATRLPDSAGTDVPGAQV